MKFNHALIGAIIFSSRMLTFWHVMDMVYIWEDKMSHVVSPVQICSLGEELRIRGSAHDIIQYEEKKVS